MPSCTQSWLDPSLGFTGAVLCEALCPAIKYHVVSCCRDLQVLVSAIADCEREVSQRAAVQVVTCVAGVQQSNLTAAVQSGILKVSRACL